MKLLPFNKRLMLLNFLANQRAGTSLKFALESYAQVTDINVQLMIDALDSGEGEEDTLYEFGYLASIQATLLKFSEDKKATYLIIADSVRRDRLIKSGVQSKLYIFGGGIVLIFILTSIFHTSMLGFETSLNKFLVMAHKPEIHIFLLEEWWAGILYAFSMIGLFYFGGIILRWLYHNAGEIYYYIFRFRKQTDIYSFLLTIHGFIVAKKSPLTIFAELSAMPQNNVWGRFFEESVEILAMGGTLQEATQLESCPLDRATKVHLAIGEKAEALDEYIQLAISELETSISSIPQKIGLIITWAEAVVQVVFVYIFMQIFGQIGF